MGEAQVNCYFWSPEKEAPGPATGRKCEKSAAGFVRVKQTGRLCPLCGPCADSFKAAQAKMSDEAKKGLPGEGSFAEVSLADGAAEYAVQPPKK